MDTKLYLTTMHRWGSSETHNYIRFVTDSLEEAEKDAKEHVEERDGKYDAVVWELIPNERAKAICTYGGIGDRQRHEGDALGYAQYDHKFEEANIFLSQLIDRIEPILTDTGCYCDLTAGGHGLCDHCKISHMLKLIKEWQSKQGRKISFEKVVINSRPGGFGLSQDALKWLIENKNWKCIDDTVVKNTREYYDAHLYKDNEGVLYLNSGGFFQSEESVRSNQDIVTVVESLGEKANDECAHLKIIEIPDDMIWTVEEAIGEEWIAEYHRTYS